MNNNASTSKETEVINTKKQKFLSLKTLIIALLIISAVTSYFIITNLNIVKSYSNKVYPGVYVLDTDLSNLSKEELHDKLTILVEKLLSKNIKVTTEGKEFTISFKELEASIDFSQTENEIFNYGKDFNFFKKLSLIKKAESKEFALGLSYNEELLENFISNISSAVDIAPTNATINFSGNSISISDDVSGIKLNSEKLKEELSSKIKDLKSPELIEIAGTTDVVEAKIKKADLSTVNYKLSSYTTHYKAGPSGTNLQLAARNINNSVVMPGETFSTEKAIGPTTIENGFVEANTYVGGQVVPGVGGGVCQVASTLYNTILRAGIIPTERMNHMMKVTYVPIGLDATLADNLIDLKFQNDFDYPLVIHSYAYNGSLTIELWSNESVDDGITYEAVSVPLSDLSADAYLYGYDSNGNLVVNQYLNRSTYLPFN
ncbi:VanW family protein [Caproiciproducens sp. MSJ-32]|uniref:VanW family protein n=1 Tax=Caproiciproducens sp. MSJ-32 TaxID=2841527 RepID=UPI001C10814D|nr:VanW family protein [Caproiciproducens sp. MSJ-32]MBU5454832.1 VanW family protein [Caproiciproducens sp. MSJ-32]